MQNHKYHQDYIKEKHYIFEVISNLLHKYFVYGGIADLGWPNTLQHAGLAIPIFNDNYQSIRDNILSILKQNASVKDFSFIKYMTLNKIRTTCIEIDKSYNNIEIIKYDNQKFSTQLKDNNFYTKLLIPIDKCDEFKNNLCKYADAARCVQNKLKINDTIYFYIIRPSVDSLSYNGAVYVTTYRPLYDFELSVISLCLSGVFTPMTINAIRSESLKSAVSAIMTRNMSHNLGSHYLHYTKTQLEQLAKKGGEFGPDIRGAARVMGYMQGRMDYLATLISMDRYPYGCVNFKSQIFDELTIDDFSKRHFPHKKIKPNELKEKIDILCQRMKALQSIQSKLSDEKYIVDEEYIKFRKNIDTNLMDLHTISGDALKDENHNRTTNFLLSNLILSENFTRPSILDDNLKVANNLNKINLQVLLFENDKSEIFTGTLDKKDSEEDIKRKLSEINIAMPGGVMSCHAFFNIVENFIRNSAKYLQSDFDKDGNLTITIKITEINGYYEFTIFDNKQNANKKQFGTTKSLLDNLLDKISNLRILDDNNALDKKDKGFKEMLFSALWLRSYMYQNVTDDDSPHSYEEVLVRIQSEEDDKKRKETIKEYGFSLLAVNNWGIEDSSEHANLALRFILPKFEEIVDVKLMDNNLSVNLCTMLNCHGDVVCVDNDKFNSFVDQMNETRKENKDTYEKDMIIPRMVTAYSNSISALKAVLHKRFGDEFEKYHIIFSKKSLKRASNASDNEKMKFARHLSTQDKMEIYTSFAYADSISGGNFTITLADVLTRWENDGFSEDSDAYYQILKIKESALTRITIIDERFFKKMKEQQLETELACKNIRILNYNDSMSEQTDVADFLEGNAFNNNENQTHFLSIHLGIIEKITKNVDMFKKIENNNEKVRMFMKMLKEHFGPKVFISVHSGRGNFSAELEDALDMYPFISMAALENAYENSKYLLSQLFYSTIYIGKGVANQHNKQDS